jgi:hypothetical protein
VDEVPPSARSLRPELDAGLDTILRTCLEKEAGRRYASAGGLADNLGRWLRGDVVQSRPRPRLRRILWATILALGAAAVLAVGLFLIRWPRTEKTPGPAGPAVSQPQPIEANPANGRWIYGENAATILSADREPFCVRSTDMSLLELSPPPPWDRYRLEADVWHKEGGDGIAGLFLGHGLVQTKQGACHRCLLVGFADYGGRAGSVSLALARLPASGSRPTRTPTCGRPYPFDPLSAKPMDDPWRHLAVEVSPDETSVFWNGTRALTVSRGGIQEVNDKIAFKDADAGPDYMVQGDFGLYVANATASFRNVRLKPLP